MIRFEKERYTVNEGAGSVTLVLLINLPYPNNVAVVYSTTDGTARGTRSQLCVCCVCVCVYGVCVYMVCVCACVCVCVCVLCVCVCVCVHCVCDLSFFP